MGTGRTRHARLANSPGAAIPFTRVSVIRPFVDFLGAIGAPVERFLQQARIPVTLLEQPEALVPLHLAHSFLEYAANAEGIDHLGLAVGQQTSAYDLGVFGELLRHALTVYDYLQTGIQLIGSVTSGQQFWLAREGDQVRINWYSPGKVSLGRCHGDLYTLTTLLRMLRCFADGRWNPEEMRLLTGNERLLGNADAFYDARIVTGQTRSSFTIPLTLLQLPILPQISGRQLRQGLPDGLQPAMPEDLASSVEQVIASLLPDDCPDVHLAAEAAGMSTRTLQRRLGDVGLSYSHLLNRARMRLAAKWLADTTISVAEIAAALGYSDPANFTRAFRRKAGVSPQQYRALIKD